MKALTSLLTFIALCASATAEVRVETISVPMRDGIKLATDIYRDDAVSKAPVVLMRTPYDRTKAKGTAEKFAKAGYIAVMQDCRGTRASEGVMAPYNNEGQDGYDTIEWITRQPWCSGRVGMMGGSYVGAVQWQAAVEQPRGLAALAPEATWSSFHRNIYLGGAVRLSLIAGWIAGNTAKPEGVKAADMNVALMRLPLSDVDEVIGWPMPWAVKLVDVRPDGFAQNLATGILRGRYRDSLLKPQPLKPGEVYEITVDLGPCAATIAKGHKLRVDICGSLFPLYDRNPNTGEGPFGSRTAIATEQVHHKPGALSRIVLPCRKP